MILFHQFLSSGRKFLRLLFVVGIVLFLNIVCYYAYRGFVLNNLGREGPVVKNEDDLVKLTGIVPLELIETIHDQQQICAGSPFRILICVKSTITNTHRRKLIRKSWASVYGQQMMDARVVFVVGKSHKINSSFQNTIETESKIYKDIIQGNFTDSYRNITIKSLFLLSWAKSHCKNAEYIMSSDDDTFINSKNMKTFLNSLKSNKGVLVGIRVKSARPYRQPASKWYASYESYREEFYPPFLTGSGYIMSADVMKKLQVCTLSTPLFHLDDVLITGICAKKLGITSEYHKEFSQRPLFSYACYVKDVVTSADMAEEDIIRVWNEVIAESHYSSTWCLFSEEYYLFTYFNCPASLTLHVLSSPLHDRGIRLTPIFENSREVYLLKRRGERWLDNSARLPKGP
ncbi:Beta-1,3-galactosyltransferase 1 [Nymphon striatum]|nr:Beta-1,3-galactosyltransferase 1 [Nymphon striatum]